MADAAARQQKTETVAKLYDGKLRLERRNDAARIYARTFLQGKNVIKSTGERTVSAATKVATDWYLDMRDRMRKGEDLHGKSFAQMAEAFLLHADQLREVSEGQRRNYRQKWALLKPHFQTNGHAMKVTDVDTRFLLALREARAKSTTKKGAPVRPATLKKDFDFVRLVLRHARSIEKTLEDLPEFPSFRGEAWEVVPNPRPFLDHEEWVKVRKLGKARTQAKDLNPRTLRQRQELYWFMLICVGAALRVGEAYSLRWRDCELITLGDADQTEAVHMKVLGKHSRGGVREEALKLVRLPIPPLPRGTPSNETSRSGWFLCLIDSRTACAPNVTTADNTRPPKPNSQYTTRAGSENSDHVLSGNSGHLPVALPGQKIV